jgi:very-short-patch-repair endonuclease
VRYNALVVGGWTVLRFTWEQVMFSPQVVVATVRAALALPVAA